MSTDKLLYDGDYWKTVLENDIKTKSLDEKLHLIFTLVIFLQISIAQLLNFIFTSRIKEVQNRAARFLGHTPTATSEDKAFPAGMSDDIPCMAPLARKFPESKEEST